MPEAGVSIMGEARRLLAEEAYGMSIERLTYTQIGAKLDISRQLAAVLCREEADRRNSERKHTDREKSIATYEAVIASALVRLKGLAPNSLNVTGLHNTIVNAQSKIDAITGVLAPRRFEGDMTYRDERYDLSKASDSMLQELEEYIDAEV